MQDISHVEQYVKRFDIFFWGTYIIGKYIRYLRDSIFVSQWILNWLAFDLHMISITLFREQLASLVAVNVITDA